MIAIFAVGTKQAGHFPFRRAPAAAKKSGLLQSTELAQERRAATRRTVAALPSKLRPERQEFVEQLEKVIPFYRCRLSVKPGLSGWAQVKYSYTSTDQESLVKLQHDLYYIKHQSFTLDILIILKTGIEMLLCRGR